MSDAGIPAREFPSVGAIAGGYGLNVRTYSPHDGGYLLETNEGRFWLKPFAGNEPELRFVVAASEHVRARGFTQLCRALRLLDGSAGVLFRHLPHYVIELPPEPALPLKTTDELLRVGELLAQFHLAGREFVPPPEVAEIRMEWGNCERQFKERLLDLYDFQEVCYDRTRPTRFDQEYVNRFSEFADVARASISIVAELPIAQMVAGARRLGQLCHGAFGLQSLASNLGAHVITDLELVCRDLAARDIADLIRSVADWDPERAIAVLRGYISIAPLTVEDLRVVQAILLFPREYWRAARAYYRDGVNTRASINEAVASLDSQRRFVEALDRVSLPSGNWDAVSDDEPYGTGYVDTDGPAPPVEPSEPAAVASPPFEEEEAPADWWPTPAAPSDIKTPTVEVPLEVAPVEMSPIAEPAPELAPPPIEAAAPEPVPMAELAAEEEDAPADWWPTSTATPAAEPPVTAAPEPPPMAELAPEEEEVPPDWRPTSGATVAPVEPAPVAPPIANADAPAPDVPMVLPTTRPSSGKLVWRFPPPLPKRPEPPLVRE